MRTVILPLDSNIDNAYPKNRFFYRAYATNPVSIRISSFCLTKIPGFSAKAALFVYVYVSLLFFTATSVLFKTPFLHR